MIRRSTPSAPAPSARPVTAPAPRNARRETRPFRAGPAGSADAFTGTVSGTYAPEAASHARPWPANRGPAGWASMLADHPLGVARLPDGDVQVAVGYLHG